MSRTELLDQFLAEVWGRPYQIGKWDCILFIAAWADLLAGSSGVPPGSSSSSLTAALRGRYTTEHEAIRNFAPQGINPAIAATLAAHGWHFVPASAFHPGDIILTDLHHPGIWNGAAILAQPARSTGLLHLHPRHATLALCWPV